MARRLLLLALAVIAPEVRSQSLLFSLFTDVPGSPSPYRKEEILRLAAGGGTLPFLPREAFAALVGDRDQNGAFDDAPANIDAFEASGSTSVTGWLFSVAANFTLAGGTTIKDGDVFRFNGTGGVAVAWSEDFLAQATGTTTVDVDAFASAPDGTIWWSFEEDEVTTDAALIAQNGGNATLDEQTVFRLVPGQTTAAIHFTQGQVAAFFSQALGVSVTTVVDVIGLAVDPAGASGDLLITSGSTSQALRGRIVTSAGGGQVPLIGGSAFDPASLGLGSGVTLDALAWSAAGPAHPVLRALPETGSSSAGGPGSIVISGLGAGTLVRMVVTAPVLPGPYAWIGSSPTGFGAGLPDPLDPMFAGSFAAPAWLLTADAAGTATYTFDFLGLAPGALAMVQAVTIPAAALTTPAVVGVLP